MSDILIISVKNKPIEHLVNWANHFKLTFDVSSDWKNINKPYLLVITSNLYPSPELLRSLMSEKEEVYPLSFTEFQGEWCPQFAIVNYTPKPLLSYYEKDVVKIDTIYTNKSGMNPIFQNFFNQNIDYHTTMESLIVQMWYKPQNEFVTKLLYPLWLDNYHRNYKVINSSYEHMLNQCSFYPALKRDPNVNENSVTLEEFCKIVNDNPITFLKCQMGLTRKSYLVDVPKSLISKHPLTISGEYELVAIGKEPEMDTSVTIVTFFFSLNLPGRSDDVYLNSLREIAKLKYPIVYFGDEKSANFVLEEREKLGLKAWTNITKMKLEDWELLQKYPTTKEEDQEQERFKNKKYLLTTNIKFYALERAIKMAYFGSSNYAWIDAGLYKNKFSLNFRSEQSIFKNFPFQSDRVIVQSLSQVSMEEITKGSIVSMIMAGGRNGWKKLLDRVFEFMIASFDEGIFTNEQNILSRVDYINPELITRRSCGYSEGDLENFLGF
jgi:hypothetical protein